MLEIDLVFYRFVRLYPGEPDHPGARVKFVILNQEVSVEDYS